MHLSPIIFAALTLLSSCSLTVLAAPTEDTATSPIEEGVLARYRIVCNGGNQRRCEPGGSAHCRCDSFGTFLCGDRQCRKMCGCQRYTSPFRLNYLSSTVHANVRLKQEESSSQTPASATGQSLQRSIAHDDTDIDIVWNNLHAESDFTVFRKKSDGPMERILMDFARVVDAGVFEEVVSVNASKYMFCVTVICSKGWDEVSEFVLGVL